MVSVNFKGRLGNNLIQYFVAKLFSEKNDFYFNSITSHFGYDWSKIISNNKNGEIKGKEFFLVNDDNFIDIFEKNELPVYHYIFDGFFQKKYFFTRFENDIKKLINFTHEEQKKDDFFIHYRIGDIINDRRMLPVEYYEEIIKSMNGMGFISSDTIGHPNCNYLIQKYGLVPILNLSPLDTIMFGKNFNNIILSEGTFSWWIGFLSNGQKIFYNDREYKWHGDLFLDRWIKNSWDYDDNYILDNIRLSKSIPIKK